MSVKFDLCATFEENKLIEISSDIFKKKTIYLYTNDWIFIHGFFLKKPKKHLERNGEEIQANCSTSLSYELFITKFQNFLSWVFD